MLSAVAPEVTIVSDKKPQPGLKYGRIKRAPKLVLKKEKSSDSSSSSSDNGEDSSCGEDEGISDISCLPRHYCCFQAWTMTT